MARMHKLPFIFFTLLCSQIFALKVLADDRSLPQIGSVEIISENVEKVTNNSNSSVIGNSVIASVEVINSKFKGDSVNAQVSLLNMQFNAAFSKNNYDINDDSDGQDISPLFVLASLYRFSDSTQVGLHYNNGPVNEINTSLINTIESDTPRTEIVELAVQHKFNNNFALIANANWKNWSSVDGHDNGRYNGSYNNNDADKYDDTFGAGTALSYQVNSWTLQTGLSIDSTPVSSNKSSSILGLNEQWRLGFGGIKKLNENMSLGMSYQYQSIGTTKVGREQVHTSATNSDDNIHFITTTLSF